MGAMEDRVLGLGFIRMRRLLGFVMLAFGGLLATELLILEHRLPWPPVLAVITGGITVLYANRQLRDGVTDTQAVAKWLRIDEAEAERRMALRYEPAAREVWLLRIATVVVALLAAVCVFILLQVWRG